MLIIRVYVNDEEIDQIHIQRGEATDLTPSDAEMQKHYDRGEMASPAPLPAEVEAAIRTIEHYTIVGYPTGLGQPPDLTAALSTLRAALTEARQPKVVSGERAATFRQRAENSRNPK